ncbi:M23 family metallopeptidase [Microbacterium sp. TWP3-1-2b2]|uniref:M23 family metallopeptidase n=1 Tax=Microbacterium sp. TWP3-1-2b2 TaxID=2804651 RepID=UPI003CF2EF49
MRAQSRRDQRVATVCRAIAFTLLLVLLSGAAVVPPTPEPPWIWPVDGDRAVTAPFRAPAHAYASGHRGVDIAAPVGTVVHAPADGIVAFRGVVVDRPLVTIDHGGGIVTTFEPVESTLMPGAAVTAGEEIGTVGRGGHTAADELHLGVRFDDVYINPMLMFADVPRAILLPCCSPTAGTSAAGVPSAGAPDPLKRGGGRVGRSL